MKLNLFALYCVVIFFSCNKEELKDTFQSNSTTTIENWELF